ncbi:sodium:proton antiporter [Anaerosporomusa subterranea]|uniref:Sodium:proton antiporter n=1 Tax=Anaerosporomusa subterranea TaxID=1794912 RepID=A0A154BW59_ANASB|nr:sodium:proton antiporter [Anaerosporomusa subterranea]KYZ78020.1 sodium:proton antiporter [Anaerosporomusa subterranea]
MKRSVFVKKCCALSGIVFALLLALPQIALAAGGEAGKNLGNMLPMWSVIPFVGILLSIALGPLVNLHWWEHNMAKVSLFWGLLFLLPFALGFGAETAVYNILHMYVIDYIPFIILLAGLFVISGGIIVRGSLVGAPKLNTIVLLIGSVLASCIGTTGASMVLIRPLIRANLCRTNKVHTIVFFIFTVSNIGGSLTPIGDPPLFLGFLHGVPFFWTMKMLPLFFLNITLLLAAYYLLDSFLYKKEQQSLVNSAPAEISTENEPVRVVGLINIVFLFGVIAAVILSGVLAKSPLFYDASREAVRGITLFTSHGHSVVLAWINLARDVMIIFMAVLSWKVTPMSLQKDNCFTWGPIKEVAVLFAGIFATIIPAIAILQARGGELGVNTPVQFFWASGMLSSFLDNAPTYLAFLSLAGGLGLTSGVWTDLGYVTPQVLLAISAGSVFMGANTYIGNAPNFMVRSIAEENQIKMPSFFGYMAWSVCILLPLFVLNTLLFF